MLLHLFWQPCAAAVAKHDNFEDKFEEHLADLHFDELGKSSGSQLLALSGGAWLRLCHAIESKCSAKVVAALKPEIDAMAEALPQAVDAYVEKKVREKYHAQHAHSAELS